MPKQQRKKDTVTVTMSWFSSDPVFAVALEAIQKELEHATTLSAIALAALVDLVILNHGEPFHGHTSVGPHTTISFEARRLSRAIFAADVITGFLSTKFDMGRQTGGVQVRFAGKRLGELLDSLEVPLMNAQADLRGTRRFLPSERIKKLRDAAADLYI